MLGSMNPDYCVMLGLSVFLEEWIQQGPGRTSQWLFFDGATTTNSTDDEIDLETARCKSRLYNAIIMRVVRGEDFVVDPAASFIMQPSQEVLDNTW